MQLKIRMHTAVKMAVRIAPIQLWCWLLVRPSMVIFNDEGANRKLNNCNKCAKYERLQRQLRSVASEVHCTRGHIEHVHYCRDAVPEFRIPYAYAHMHMYMHCSTLFCVSACLCVFEQKKKLDRRERVPIKCTDKRANGQMSERQLELWAHRN